MEKSTGSISVQEELTKDQASTDVNKKRGVAECYACGWKTVDPDAQKCLESLVAHVACAHPDVRMVTTPKRGKDEITWFATIDKTNGEENVPDSINFDPVINPEHYTSGSLECIDWIEAEMTNEEFAGYLKGNIFKYIWRHENKGHPVQDLSKARWYLDRLINLLKLEEAGLK